MKNKLPLWINILIALCTIVATAWAAEARFNQSHELYTVNESIKRTGLAIQEHARDDLDIRIIQLESRDNLAVDEREKLLFYKNQKEQILRVISRLSQ